MPEHKIAESTVNIALTVGFYFAVFGLGSFVCGFKFVVVVFFPSVIPAGGIFASNKDKKSWGKNTTDHPENCLNSRTNGK